ncbi:PREDICTED: synaptotagmin-5-like isoform X4 [Lupinus angustifolius]|uniref:synaptotagmin-5-like isoform X4 n=1 Tax=Lupinus angustifolius TaxID=3871 RepID=UPI00092FC7D0|nr:PREDICTED: synaptotagmin-5-like isoform X4 [Lupinus angustifolius]
MSRKKMRFSVSNIEEAAVNFFNYLLQEKPQIPIFIPLILIAWAIERWVFSFSTWVPLVLAVWATIQYGRYQRKLLEEDLDKKWRRVLLNSSPITPLEHCEWLNKLLTEIWPNYFNPRLSLKLSAIVETRLKLRKPRLLERVELQEFSLGSCPPSLGLQGMRWSTIGDQRVMQVGFDWDTNEMSILLLAKLAKPLIGTARIVVNNLHIKGDLLITPILDGKALSYSFVSTPEVRVGIAFGSGGSQSLPATEWPGVSSWLEKLFADTLVKTMVEPRRRCLSLPVVDLRKKVVGGIIYIKVISANKLSRSCFKAYRRPQNGTANGFSEDNFDDKYLHTFVEAEVEELTRRTDVRLGSTPRWDAPFNMVLHDSAATLRFNLYESCPSSVKCDYLASCEIKIMHVEGDSTIMWAIGPDSEVIAKQAQFCGDEIEMVVPFEGANSAELKVRIIVKEWQFSDASHSLNNIWASSQQPLNGSSNLQLRTGRKLNISVVEGKNLAVKDKSGKFDPYFKLQYGKVIQKTRTARTANPVWYQSFEFDEIGGGEYLKIKGFTEETFGDENIGSAQVNLEGLTDGLVRDVWVPLERAQCGEIRLKIEAVKAEDQEGSRGSALGSSNGWIELVLIEGRDLIAADRRGTSDPYVRVQYGNLKKRTKVISKTLNPCWNQTLEFPDDGSPLELHVKDHNALLPTSSIGECVVEYQRLPLNQMADKWIPLQGVKRGEIHIQITRKVAEIQRRNTIDEELSLSKLHGIPNQIMIKCRTMIEDENLEGLSTALSELETLVDTQRGYIVQLETEELLLLRKIKELGLEIISSSPSSSRGSSYDSGN